MGVITNLIRVGREKKAADEEMQLKAFELAKDSDDPKLRQWGIDSITQLGMKHAPNPEIKKNIPVISQIGQVLGKLTGHRQQGQQQGGPPPIAQGRGMPPFSQRFQPPPQYSQERVNKAQEERAAQIAENEAAYARRQQVIQDRSDEDYKAHLGIELKRNTLKIMMEDDADQALVDSGHMSADDALERKRKRQGLGGADEKGIWHNVEITFPNNPKIPAVSAIQNQNNGQIRTLDQKPYTPPAGAHVSMLSTVEGVKRSEWVLVPGSDTPIEALLDPRRPGGYLKVEDGSPLPEGTRKVATPTAMRPNQQFAGFYWTAKGRGLSDEEAKRYAGDQFEKNVGYRLAAIQQNMAIQESLSGIPPGPGLGGAPRTGGTPAAPAPPQASTGRGLDPARPVAVAGGPPAPSARQVKNRNLYLQSLFGTLPAATSGAARVGINEGMQEMQRESGLSPVEFQLAAAAAKDKLKGIADTWERYSAMVRLNSVIDALGPIVIESGKEITDTKSPVLNQAWRSINLATVDNPKIRRYLLAINALQRQYTTLTAGGALSRASLPVHVGEAVDKLLDPNQTLASAIETVDQIAVEGKAEQTGLQDAVKRLQDEVKGSALGGGRGTPGSTTPKKPLEEIFKQ